MSKRAVKQVRAMRARIRRLARMAMATPRAQKVKDERGEMERMADAFVWCYGGALVLGAVALVAAGISKGIG